MILISYFARYREQLNLGGSTSANGAKSNALHASTCTTSIPSF